jgi:tetratricopeptide (TPR) repeat protein
MRFARSIRTLGLLALTLALALPMFRAARVHAEGEPAAMPGPLARGDEAYAHGDLAAAAAAYDQAFRETPDKLTALCRLVRAQSEMAEDSSGEAQQRLLSSAVTHARDAVAAAPDSAIGHVWLAVALGRQALHEGPKTRLALAREIKSEVDRGIAIDPNIGRAYHVRGAWNRNIASLSFVERAGASMLGGVPSGASMENAIADFEKAVQLEPEYVNHRLELGRTYHMVHRDADARRELEKCIALAPVSSARDAHYQTEARQLLSRLPKPK